MKDEQKLKRLTEALEDHSEEGIAILASEPSRLMRYTILMIVGFMFTAVIWSFFGRADVIVTAAGALSPDSEVRRFYAPIQGELVDIFIAEGQPVSKGDVLARLNAREAVQVAANSLEAELKLSNARRELQRLPGRLELMQRKVAALDRQIEVAGKLHEKRMAEGMAKLGESQKAKLEEARGNLEKTRRTLAIAQRELAKYRRLHNLAGGGGISRNQVDEQQSAVVIARANFDLAKARLGELDFELGNEYAEAKAQLDGSDQKLTELKINRDAMKDEIEYEGNKVSIAVKSAELEAQAAARIKFENIDEENFLRILAPVSGVITQVAYTQQGDKIQANTPLGGIAAEDSRPILEVEINESDRGFLEVGQEAKLKFNAFPYQRYGFITGRLEYISPSTQVSAAANQPVFKGRITLERDHFEVQEELYPLRYGMAAVAEIVVRKRRLIDLALDPFRNVKG